MFNVKYVQINNSSMKGFIDGDVLDYEDFVYVCKSILKKNDDLGIKVYKFNEAQYKAHFIWFDEFGELRNVQQNSEGVVFFEIIDKTTDKVANTIYNDITF